MKMVSLASLFSSLPDFETRLYMMTSLETSCVEVSTTVNYSWGHRTWEVLTRFSSL